MKLYQLVGIHPFATVSVVCYMGESPRAVRCSQLPKASWRGEQAGTS